MATTIVTKSGSGAPTTSDLVAGELAVDLTNKRLYTENSGGTVLELGTNPASDVTFGDNTKAIFGAGSDLQIYHDGSNSFIQESGTGDLKIRSNKIRMEAPDSQNMIIVTEDAGVQAFYNGTERLSVTNTGIDVTGTVTADGLTVGSNNRIQGTGGLFIGGSTATVFEVGAGSEKMRLTSTGLGIGTSSPEKPLHVNSSTGNIGIRVESTDATASIEFMDSGTTSTSTSARVGGISNDFFVQTNGLERMRIDSSGNVGIGTDSPAYPLHVWSDTTIARLGGTDTNDTYLNIFKDNASSIIKIQASKAGTGATNVAINPDGGSVGIGTATFTGANAYMDDLVVYNATAGTGAGLSIIGNATNGYSNIAFGDTADWDTGRIQYNHADNSMAFHANSAERMRIDASGALLLNPNNAARGLKITTTQGEALGSDTTYDTIGAGYGKHIFKTDGAERMRIDASGNLLVGVTSGSYSQVVDNNAGNWAFGVTNSGATSPYGLIVSFSGSAPNNTTSEFLNCSDTVGNKALIRSNGGLANFSANNANLSDRRSKKDITLHTDSEWDCVKAWEIVDYRYKADADDLPTKIGVIAQQIQDHCPELVSVFQEQSDAVEEVLDEDGEVVTAAKPAFEERIGVNEPQMMWKVTKALQEAMTRIETLEARIAQLES